MASEGCGRSDDLGPPITVQANRTSVVRYLSDKTASQRRDTFPAVTTASTRSPRPTLLGVPYDAGSSYLRGPASAPPLIHAPSNRRHPIAGPSSVATLAIPGISTTPAISLSLPATSAERLKAARVISSPIPIFLGGDHSITYPLLRAIQAVSTRPTILHIDAHADLYDEFEGDRYSHACPFARIMEEKLASRLVQVGIRTLTAHLREQIDRFAVDVIDMRAWTAGKRPLITGPVYLSLDLDALDPAFAPGVSHWEPGGLTVREVITLIQELGRSLIGADVVEYNPLRDPSGVTAMVAAKLVKEIACRMTAD